MAPYAENYTPRVVIDYFVCGRTHSHTLRPVPVMLGQYVQEWWLDVGRSNYYDFWLGLGGAVFADFRIVKAEWYAAGGHVSQPLDIGTNLPVSGGPPWPPSGSGKKYADYHCTLTGRGLEGRLCSLKTYGIALAPDATGQDPDDDGLALPGERPWVVQLIQGWRNLNLASIDGSPVTWPNKVTTKRNDYWLGVTRG